MLNKIVLSTILSGHCCQPHLLMREVRHRRLSSLPKLKLNDASLYYRTETWQECPSVIFLATPTNY